jgi:hypothetical protein
VTLFAYAASYEVSAASEATLFWVWEKVIAGGENGGGENPNGLGLRNVRKIFDSSNLEIVAHKLERKGLSWVGKGWLVKKKVARVRFVRREFHRPYLAFLLVSVSYHKLFVACNTVFV